MSEDETQPSDKNSGMLAEIYQQLQKRWEGAREERDKIVDVLFPRLVELRVFSVIVKCEGGGDQGEIVSIDLMTVGGAAVPSLDETECNGRSLRDVIEDTVYLTLAAEHPGWELDAGSDSTYRIDPFFRKVWCERFLPLDEPDFDEDEDEENGGGDSEE